MDPFGGTQLATTRRAPLSSRRGQRRNPSAGSQRLHGTRHLPLQPGYIKAQELPEVDATQVCP